MIMLLGQKIVLSIQKNFLFRHLEEEDDFFTKVLFIKKLWFLNEWHYFILLVCHVKSFGGLKQT